MIPLLPEAPEELLTERTERRLPKKLGHELVSVRVMGPLVLHGTSPLGNIPRPGLAHQWNVVLTAPEETPAGNTDTAIVTASRLTPWDHPHVRGPVPVERATG